MRHLVDGLDVALLGGRLLRRQVRQRRDVAAQLLQLALRVDLARARLQAQQHAPPCLACFVSAGPQHVGPETLGKNPK